MLDATLDDTTSEITEMADSTDGSTDDSAIAVTAKALGLPALPPWAYLLLILLGVPVLGGSGSYIGSSQHGEDVDDLIKQVDKLDESLETKVDKLNNKLDKLIVQFARAHPDSPQ